ncbi:DNA translocase FtsK [Niallia sp.]|uniref:DNA translocase FtsK n=1 Tax=Niallia sp. TaxID=2837523 RepID=UPI002896D56B|nr:DNA translocase FtsK [Niallia sp.]
MNWFKKVFKQFVSEEDELNQIEETVETIEIDDQPNKESTAWKKEMDSKVIYQYPKGNFRFPLIPDGDEDDRKEIERKKRRETRQTVVDDRREINQPFERPFAEQPKNNVKDEQSTNTYSPNRPFKPTEIVSPIYGYNRPEIKVERKEPSTAIPQPEINRAFDISEELTSIQTEEMLTDELLALDEVRDKIAVSQEQATTPKNFVKQETDLDPILSLFTEEWLDEEQSSHHDDREDISLEVEEIASPASEMDHQAIGQMESLVDEQEHNEQQILLSEELEITEEKAYTQNREEQAEEKREEEIPKRVEEKTATTRKGPLPFNVLMLNKDRQSLANKRVEKKVDDEPNLQPKLEDIAPPISENDYEDHHDLPYYVFPEEKLLHPPILQIEKDGWIEEQTMLLNDTFTNFNVHAKVVNVTQGPSVTRYEVQPEPGVKVSKITNLSDDLKLSLAAKDIRIEAPIPGKHTVGIEVPNQKSRPVLIREILESDEFKNSSSPLTVAMGLDISGKPIVTDLRKMPHGLIAGATGSGKSVCINTMLVSLLYKAKPEELKLLLVDPKMVELAPYNYVPHLASPVITDVKTATAALKWAVEEMERRYELLAHVGVRDITKYNQLAEEHKRYSDKLPYLVIVIDELADLMMMAPADVEEAISRIAQKARACGIHLLIATQRPSVDVITGLIKANVPTRIAFSVSSQIDSRTVIDISGAEKLLGKGDMLFLENGTSKPVRLQGTFVSDEEIDQVVAHVRRERKPEYLFEQEELLKKVQMSEEEDELFYEACEFIIEQGGASTSSLQRNFKIGYNRAARLIDMMEKQGFISEARGTKARDVLITESELLQLQDSE